MIAGQPDGGLEKRHQPQFFFTGGVPKKNRREVKSIKSSRIKPDKKKRKKQS